MPVLDLTDAELNMVVQTVWAKLSGLSPVRTTLEDKLRASFEDTFGVDPTKVSTSRDTTSYVSSDRVQEEFDNWKRASLTEVVTFLYHGVERKVKDPVIDTKRNLLSGIEVTRAGKGSNRFKHFKLDQIG